MANCNFGRPENGMTSLGYLQESARGCVIIVIFCACSDKDECGTNEHDCDDNADCYNMPGSYECECRIGYTGTGQECDGMYANSPILFHLDLLLCSDCLLLASSQPSIHNVGFV